MRSLRFYYFTYLNSKIIIHNRKHTHILTLKQALKYWALKLMPQHYLEKIFDPTTLVKS